MRSSLWLSTSFSLLASATPFSTRGLGVSDVANDMQDTIDGKVDCASTAVIFARGTFDSGNIGVWVGPQFSASLKSLIPSLAFQGVSSDAYAADLKGYLEQGGSDDGAASMADTISAYIDKCPECKIIVSGWSQGALVAHKALGLLSSTALERISGVTTFGDPWEHFDNTPLPEPLTSSSIHTECFTADLTFDPLCAPLSLSFHIPSSLSEVIEPFKKLPSVAQGLNQTKAAAELMLRFPGQLADSWDGFVDTLGGDDDWIRLALSPQHFMYGNQERTKSAADWVAQL